MNPKIFAGSMLLVLAWCAAATPTSAGDVIAWNKRLAGQYLDERAQKWFEFSAADRGVGTAKISCVSCHSLLPYALARPVLRKLTGTIEATSLETRLLEQIESRVEHWRELDSKKYRLFYDFSEQKKKESWGTEAILNSLVLAFDDHSQGRKVPRDATRKSFANLWQVQLADGNQAGSWEWLDFGLEPWESNGARYFAAALAALAVGSAPGYYAPGVHAGVDEKVTLLRNYLRTKMATQNLNNQIWLLWAATKLEGLLTKEEQRNISEAIFQKQQADGGWSLASLGTKSRDGLQDAAADGYATGLILHVLQTAGFPKNDARLARGLAWLRSSQMSSGAWRADSVNKKRDPSSHVGKFMSDAATAFAVLALSH